MHPTSLPEAKMRPEQVKKIVEVAVKERWWELRTRGNSYSTRSSGPQAQMAHTTHYKRELVNADDFRPTAEELHEPSTPETCCRTTKCLRPV
jgi:hypothetical protein